MNWINTKVKCIVHMGLSKVKMYDKNVDWVYRSLEFDNAILREGDPVTVGAGIILR